ncbi:hypothetical protein K0C01_05125 [Salinarchaeum sp. IM2453]|uniref:hypothetical protein n=1 Tax=Salinarchaeum sp. IM2453 TaxID=2862870 RepID=UPI001C82C1A0|nr:hypothetical protein [Salinarchaeum sp. IM2453]QZA89515.1 hypothetical protein K0C01_05125 [Salinarchaeum sp. IM2453]
MTQLFIAPASKGTETPYQHLQMTVNSQVDKNIVKNHTKLGDKAASRLWGVTSGKIDHWNKIQPNDWILFYVSDNQIECAAKVSATEHNPDLSQALWDDYLHPTGSDHPTEPWDYLIHLSERKSLDLTAGKLREELGYSSNYDFPGFSRVATFRQQKLRKKYGSVDGFIRGFRS